LPARTVGTGRKIVAMQDPALFQAGCRSPLNNHPGQFMPASLRAITGGPTVSVVQKWRLEQRKTAGETRL
jgi:hypothetical protein